MTNKSIRDYINLIENAQREDVAEAKSDDPDYDESLKRFKKGLPPKKKSVAEEQVEESTPDALAKIDELTRDR